MRLVLTVKTASAETRQTKTSKLESVKRQRFGLDKIDGNQTRCDPPRPYLCTLMMAVTMHGAAGSAATGMPKAKLKILATHSFRTSAAIFKEQLQRSGLDKALDDLIELTFIDAPNAASGPIPDDVSPFFAGPYYEWWNAQRDEQGKWTYEGWQRAVAAIEEALRQHGPFDGLMGFSQGGAMASLAVGMQRSGFALKDAPPLRFCICFAGIKVRDPSLECFYAAMRPVPSLHIIGDKDPVKRLTNQLIDSFNHPLVINHTRGHVIPALQPPDLQRVRAFLETQLREAAFSIRIMADRAEERPRVPTAQVFPAAVRLPLVGLGTWTQRKPGEVREAVETALRLGYRHIDCAADYQNEGEVGQAIAAVLGDGTVRREEIWVTSKLQNSDHEPQRVEEACRDSLEQLGLEWLDLYLMHWPVTGNHGPELKPSLEETWSAMEALVHKGLARAIGVSNFSILKLETLLKKATIRPAVNQVEAHPYFRNTELIDWCRERGIHVTAYSPLGSPHTADFFKRREDDSTLREIAERHGKSPADVLLGGAARHQLPAQVNKGVMLDGGWFLSPEGPYHTLEELWDTPAEVATSTVAD
ncbi:NADPH-dependent aldo-keto reductase [Chlorella vulgaris]